MGAWGFKAMESDDALDWLGDLNDKMRVVKLLKKSIKQKKYSSESRAAIEYMVRSDKAGIFPIRGLDELVPIALARIEQLKSELSDIDNWTLFGQKPETKKDFEEIRHATKESIKDLNGQARYLKKAGSKVKREVTWEEYSAKDMSKKELQAAFDQLEKSRKKAPKKRAKKRTRK